MGWRDTSKSGCLPRRPGSLRVCCQRELPPNREEASDFLRQPCTAISPGSRRVDGGSSRDNCDSRALRRPACGNSIAFSTARE